MSSMLRRICANAVSGLDNPQRQVFSALVCLCDDPEVTATRTELYNRFVTLAASLGEKPKAQGYAKMLAFLRRERRGYSHKTDGASTVMGLVDAITALEDECSAMLERTKVPDTIPAPPVFEAE